MIQALFNRSTAFCLIPVLLCGAAFVAVGTLNVRWDVTEDQRHSLSPGSKELLQSLENPVTVRFYLSRSDNLLPVKLRHFSERVDSLLDTIVDISNGKVEVKRLDPKADPNAVESAVLDGIRPQTISQEAVVYMGIAVSSAGERAELPYLDPAEDTAIEYQLLSRIRKVAKRNVPRLGIISTLPIALNGGWQIIKDLREEYELVSLRLSDPIPDNLDTLLIIHPKRISRKFEKKINAFTGRGGSMVVLMDSVSLALNFLTSAQFDDLTSKWPGLMKATGLEFSGENAVADMLLSTKLDRGEGVEDLNTFLTVNEDCMHDDHVITGGMSSIALPISGAFLGDGHDNLQLTPIIQSTAQSAFSDKDSQLTANKEQTARKRWSFKADSEVYSLAVLVEGALHSFIDGKERPDAVPTKVILVGDADLIADPYAGYQEEVQGNEVFTPINNNLSLIYNALDFLKSESLLNDARSKTRQKRPLTTLRREERKIRSRYEVQLAALNMKLEKLQSKSGGFSEELLDHSRSINLDVQKNQLKRDAQMREVKAEIEGVNRTVREEVQKMKSRIQWLNTLAMPLVLAVSGIFFWSIRKHHTRARQTRS